MTGAHLHLLLNHFPLIGLFFSLLILVCGLFLSNTGFIRAGLLIALMAGVLTVPTYLSGEPAEKTIENSAGFSESLVKEHEEAAEFAIWSIGLTALACLAGLFFSIKKNYIPKPLMIGIVLLNIFSLVVIGQTNNLGGKISHAEIRN